MLFLLGVAATSCATYWTKDGFNQADWNRDSYECERDMRQSGYYGEGIFGAINAQNFQERCLVARGYYKTTRPREVANTPETPAAPPQYWKPGSPLPVANGPKKMQIDALEKLRANGSITDEEFETQRAKILVSPDF